MSVVELTDGMKEDDYKYIAMDSVGRDKTRYASNNLRILKDYIKYDTRWLIAYITEDFGSTEGEHNGYWEHSYKPKR